MSAPRTIELQAIPYNVPRGIFGAVGFGFIGWGSGLLWGPGGALLCLGAVMIIAVTIDEALERSTGVKRGDE